MTFLNEEVLFQPQDPYIQYLDFGHNLQTTLTQPQSWSSFPRSWIASAMQGAGMIGGCASCPQGKKRLLEEVGELPGAGLVKKARCHDNMCMKGCGYVEGQLANISKPKELKLDLGFWIQSKR